MNKKLISIAVLLCLSVLSTTHAQAALLDWAKPNSDNAHPLINKASDWSLTKMTKALDLTKVGAEPNNTPGPTPGPAQKLIRKNKPANAAATKTIRIVATAYSAEPGETDDEPCIAARNYDICDTTENIVATNCFPFDTFMTLPEIFGNKKFVVKDRMASRFSGPNCRIDVLMPDRQSALDFGLKVVVAEITK